MFNPWLSMKLIWETFKTLYAPSQGSQNSSISWWGRGTGRLMTLGSLVSLKHLVWCSQLPGQQDWEPPFRAMFLWVWPEKELDRTSRDLLKLPNPGPYLELQNQISRDESEKTPLHKHRSYTQVHCSLQRIASASLKKESKILFTSSLDWLKMNLKKWMKS